jgi:hypothetical protein
MPLPDSDSERSLPVIASDSDTESVIRPGARAPISRQIVTSRNSGPTATRIMIGPDLHSGRAGVTQSRPGRSPAVSRVAARVKCTA